MDRRKFIGMAAAATAGMAAGPALGAIEPTGAVPPDPSQRKKKQEPGLKVRFLGTGAADWNGPDERGEHRRLSSVLVDDSFLIDFTDTAKDMLPEGFSAKTIFYTHSHGDHYNPAAAIGIGIEKAYVSQTWYDLAVSEFRAAAGKLGKPSPKVIPLCIGSAVQVGDVTVTPLPANHATSRIFEQTQIYLVEKGPVRLLYATDTGGIPAIAANLAGIDAHRNPGNPITALIMEATMGLEHSIDFRLFTHSSVSTVFNTYTVLSQTGRYVPKDGQSVYLTHMARTLHGTQAELDSALPKPLKAAYDGLEVVFT